MLVFKAKLCVAENKYGRHYDTKHGQGHKRLNKTIVGSLLCHQIELTDDIEQHKNGKEKGEDTQNKIGKPVPEIRLDGKYNSERKSLGIKMTAAHKIHHKPGTAKQYKKRIRYIYQHLQQ